MIIEHNFFKISSNNFKEEMLQLEDPEEAPNLEANSSKRLRQKT